MARVLELMRSCLDFIKSALEYGMMRKREKNKRSCEGVEKQLPERLTTPKSPEDKPWIIISDDKIEVFRK